VLPSCLDVAGSPGSIDPGEAKDLESTNLKAFIFCVSILFMVNCQLRSAMVGLDEESVW